jgi:5-methyltetrahydropteroyltriglutamate--homocysteine methyltransferase
MSASLARQRPPFRADHVGSLLRPPELQAARAEHAGGRLPPEQLRAIEDRCIERAIRIQEDIGLRAATDGEYRRAYWHYDFVGGLAGVEVYEPEQKVAFKGATLPHALRVNGRIGWDKPVFIDDFRAAAAGVRTAVAKQTIPSPSVVHFRGGRGAIDSNAYPDMDQFFADLGSTYAQAVAAFDAAGCRYLQIDEVNIAYLCDPEQIAGLKRRGEHVEGLLGIYADMINAAIGGRRSPEMAISMHLCRGNFRSTFIASGGYEPVAETLFNRIDVDAYFMEYDSERAGGFEPLRFVPRGPKVVVLGLVTSKTGELESKNELKRRIDAAAKYLPLEQLALSPQCGFASTEEGNLLTEAQQWAKLELCVEVAREVWGGV